MKCPHCKSKNVEPMRKLVSRHAKYVMAYRVYCNDCKLTGMGIKRLPTEFKLCL